MSGIKNIKEGFSEFGRRIKNESSKITRVFQKKSSNSMTEISPFSSRNLTQGNYTNRGSIDFLGELAFQRDVNYKENKSEISQGDAYINFCNFIGKTPFASGNDYKSSSFSKKKECVYNGSPSIGEIHYIKKASDRGYRKGTRLDSEREILDGLLELDIKDIHLIGEYGDGYKAFELCNQMESLEKDIQRKKLHKKELVKILSNIKEKLGDLSIPFDIINEELGNSEVKDKAIYQGKIDGMLGKNLDRFLKLCDEEMSTYKKIVPLCSDNSHGSSRSYQLQLIKEKLKSINEEKKLLDNINYALKLKYELGSERSESAILSMKDAQDVIFYKIQSLLEECRELEEDIKRDDSKISEYKDKLRSAKVGYRHLVKHNRNVLSEEELRNHIIKLFENYNMGDRLSEKQKVAIRKYGAVTIYDCLGEGIKVHKMERNSKEMSLDKDQKSVIYDVNEFFEKNPRKKVVCIGNEQHDFEQRGGKFGLRARMYSYDLTSQRSA